MLLGCLSFARVAVATAAEAAAPSAGEQAAQTTYELFNIPQSPQPGRHGVFHDMVLDEDGVPWVMANDGTYYWSPEGFREPPSGPMPSNYFTAALFGGPERGAYATQWDNRKNEARLYRLKNGTTIPEGTFYVENRAAPPGLFVSRTGRLFNWGNRFLEERQDGKWERIEARLSQEQTLVFDLGDDVYFYCDNSLYCADATGRLQERPCPQWTAVRPDVTRVEGVLWAGKRALLVNIGEPELFAFDLPTGKVIDLAPALGRYKDVRFHRAVGFQNGNVWLVGTMGTTPAPEVFCLSADGTLAEVPGMRNLPSGARSIEEQFGAVVESSTGEVFVGLPLVGLGWYRDGALLVWGWQYGITEGPACLLRDPSGAIWFPLTDKVARLRLAAGPPPLSALADEWEQFPLMPWTGVWQTASGEIAMFRKDHPNALSRWDDREWRHQEVPFDTSGVRSCSAVDDRGHLLVSASGNGHFDIGPDSVKQFKTTEALLRDVVANGVQEFPFMDGFSDIVVTPDRRIWFGYERSHTVYMFDGNRWDSVLSREDDVGLQQSSEWGILFGVGGEKFCRYDRGQVVAAAPQQQGYKLMLSHNGLWPYDRDLVKRHPDSYLPVLRRDRRWFLYLQADDFESTGPEGARPEGPAIAELSPGTHSARPALSGGAWILSQSEYEEPLRVLGCTVQPIRLSGTPLVGRVISNIVEDGVGGLWFCEGLPEHRTACLYRLPHVGLGAAELPSTAGRELRLDVTLPPEQAASGVSLFQRLDGGAWQPVDEGGKQCIFRFPTSGKHRCEVAGFQYGGRCPGGLAFDVEATVD